MWPPDQVPSADELIKIAKGLRTVKQVQDYFRQYRKNVKARKVRASRHSVHPTNRHWPE